MPYDAREVRPTWGSAAFLLDEFIFNRIPNKQANCVRELRSETREPLGLK
jgi:hypothetical protein